MASAFSGLEKKYMGLWDRMKDYDATDAATKTAKASWEGLQQPLSESVDRLRGSQVKRGRLKTGFGFGEEDRLVRDSYQQLMRSIAQNSLQAQGLNLTARGMEGDLVSGALDRKQAKRNANKSKWSGLFGAGGAVLGTVLGGPGVGTYLGGMLGSSAGRHVG